jgi:hypothetical protein
LSQEKKRHWTAPPRRLREHSMPPASLCVTNFAGTLLIDRGTHLAR